MYQETKAPSPYLKKKKKKSVKFGKLSIITHYLCRWLILRSKNKEKKKVKPVLNLKY